METSNEFTFASCQTKHEGQVMNGEIIRSYIVNVTNAIKENVFVVRFNDSTVVVRREDELVILH